MTLADRGAKQNALVTMQGLFLFTHFVCSRIDFIFKLGPTAQAKPLLPVTFYLRKTKRGVSSTQTWARTSELRINSVGSCKFI